MHIKFKLVFAGKIYELPRGDKKLVKKFLQKRYFLRRTYGRAK